MATVGSIRIGLSATSDKFVQDMRRAGKSVTDFVGKVATVKNAIGGAIFGGAIAAGVGKAVSAFADLDSATAKSRTIFGGAADGIIAEADRMAERFGTAKADFLDAASTFGGMFKGAGKGQAEAAALGTQLAELGMDLAAFADTTNEEAFTALAAGLRGEFDPLERFGVFLSADAVAAEAVAMGLAKSTSAVDAAAKKQAALNLVLKQTTDAQGTLARESGQAGAQMKAVAGRIENAWAKAGEAIAPLTLKVLELANSGLKSLNDWLGANVAGFQSLAESGIAATEGIGGGMTVANAAFDDSLTTLDVLTIGWKGLRMAVSGTISFAVWALAKLAKGIESVLSYIPGFESGLGDGLQATFDGLAADTWKNANDIADIWSGEARRAALGAASGMAGVGDAAAKTATQVTGAAGAVATLTKEQVDLNSAVAKLGEDLDRSIAGVGKDSNRATLDELKAQGASADQLGELERKLATLAKAEAFQKLKEDAKGLADEMRSPTQALADYQSELIRMRASNLIDAPAADRAYTEKARSLFGDAMGIADAGKGPMDKFNEDLAKLKEAWGAGVLSDAQLTQGVAGLQKGLADSAKPGEAQSAGALEAGSVEARRAILAFQAKGSGDPAADTAKNTAALVAELKATPAKLAREVAKQATLQVASF